jgi:hypothetical protein
MRLPVWVLCLAKVVCDIASAILVIGVVMRFVFIKEVHPLSRKEDSSEDSQKEEND